MATFLYFFSQLPANWVNIDKEKYTGNLVKYLPKSRFCSEIYSFCLPDLKSEMSKWMCPKMLTDIKRPVPKKRIKCFFPKMI